MHDKKEFMYFTLSRLSPEEYYSAVCTPWYNETEIETKYKCVFAHSTNGPYFMHAYICKSSKKLHFDLSQG
jgi:hypothetical protein